LELVSVSSKLQGTIPSISDTFHVVFAGLGLQPRLRHLLDLFREDVEDRIVDSIPQFLASFHIFIQPVKRIVGRCRNNLSKQGIPRFHETTALIGKKRQPKQKGRDFERVHILHASMRFGTAGYVNLRKESDGTEIDIAMEWETMESGHQRFRVGRRVDAKTNLRCGCCGGV
jgi:hypothetical protein